MDSVNKTLYIPLYGKAYVSRRGLFLSDPMAEKIWAAEQFPIRGKAASRWLAFYMGIRAAVFDDWVRQKAAEWPGAAVIHIGCGMDSRVLRVDAEAHMWYDVDFPEVICERRRYFAETERYRMLPGDVRQAQWLDAIPPQAQVIVVMEGVSMYLAPEALRALTDNLRRRFENIALLMDCYTQFGARASRMGNPVKDVGVTQVFGVDDPAAAVGAGWRYAGEHDMTPGTMADALTGLERRIFKTVYGGRLSKKLYRLYEFSARG